MRFRLSFPILIFIFCFQLLALGSCGEDKSAESDANLQPSAETHSPPLGGLIPYATPSVYPTEENSQTVSGEAEPESTETVTLMYYGGEAESDSLSEAVLSRFGLTVRLVPYPSDYAALLGVLNSNAPDMFMLVLSPARLAELTAGGYIREIPDRLLAANESLDAYVGGNAAAQANRQIYGAYAYVPCDYDADPVYQTDGARFFYRKDWAATLSFEPPQNPGDLYTMASAFAGQQNPGRTDGAALTGLAVDSVAPVAALYGFDLTGWALDDGRYVPAYYSDGLLPMLNYARRLYSEGVLKFTGGADGFVTNLNDAGIVVTRADNAAELNKIIAPVAERLNISIEEALAERVGVMAAPRDPNAPKVWGNSLRQEGWMFTRQVTDAKLKKVLEFLDYTLTDEARVQSRYGFPGVTYSETPSGAFMFTDPETYAAYDLAAMYPTGGFLNLLVNDASREADANYPSAVPYPVRRLFGESARDYYAPANPADMLCRSVNSPLRDALAVDYEGYLRGIITGAEAVDAMFEAFKETCRQAGVEDVIGEVNGLISFP